jgi:two-component system chemotaxis response regulator CheB
VPPIRVLIVDDSAVMRQMLRRVLHEAGFEVVGAARDGLEAVERAAALDPDVITLDVEMPRLDGLGALERLMAAGARRIVMFSSLTEAGAAETLRALELGAVEFVQKPGPGVPLDEVAGELCRKVRAAASARPHPRAGRAVPAVPAAARNTASRHPGAAPPAAAALVAPGGRGVRLIVIASSTGGPSALFQLFGQLPGNLPAALLVVQHMPAGFTRSLAGRLDDRSALEVREAQSGDVPRRGLGLVAPGDLHLELDEGGRVHLLDTPREHGVRPAADVTLRSAVRAYAGALDLVVLTGMGVDGTAGARAVKAAGGRVVVEAESTAVVWGMPRSVVEAGLADAVVPLGDVPGWIVALAAGARQPA